MAETLTTGAADLQKVDLTMMTIDVAPKLKFMEGSAFRPWIIPIGLDIHLISPLEPDAISRYGRPVRRGV